MTASPPKPRNEWQELDQLPRIHFHYTSRDLGKTADLVCKPNGITLREMSLGLHLLPALPMSPLDKELIMIFQNSSIHLNLNPVFNSPCNARVLLFSGVLLYVWILEGEGLCALVLIAMSFLLG